MRILAIGSMYPPHHHGGYELIWESAMELLRDAGHEVAVLATDFTVPDPEPRLDPGFPVWRELRWYLRGNRFPRLSARERLAVESHNARVLGRVLGEVRPDAVAWWSMGGMSLSLIEHVRAAGIPSVAAMCDDWFAYAPEVDAWTRAFGRRPRLARAVGAVTRLPTRPDPAAAIGSWVFLSHELEARAERVGLERRRSRVAHRGPDRIFAEAAAVREHPPWRWQLLYLGRIDRRKGVDLAIEAVAELPEGAMLTVVGGGDPEELARLQALAAPERVAFDDVPREELAATVANCDALLFPVRWHEPWGLVPLEAMAAETPVVASARGGPAEYLRHEENCLVIDPDDGPAALAAAVRRLADDEPLRLRLVEGGRATAAGIDPKGFEKAVAEELELAAANTGA
ncbi:MAG TPA: glycosyltransferase [Thermoleophilaceae bacterium]